MRCDKCGCGMHAGEEPLVTTHDKPGGPLGSTAYPVRRTESVPIRLCAQCAADRNATMRMFFWAIGILIAGLLIVGFVIR